MKNVLYVDCCIRREGSRTKELAEHFLKELEKTGEYAITGLVLMDEGLNFMAEGFFRQRDELLAGKNFAHPRFCHAHQFAEADKIVIAAPFWDLSFPALLKVYIENLCVEGITFKTGERGLEGLCKADHMVYLTTRGGCYAGTPLELGSGRWLNFSASDAMTALRQKGWISGWCLWRSCSVRQRRKRKKS